MMVFFHSFNIRLKGIPWGKFNIQNYFLFLSVFTFFTAAFFLITFLAGAFTATFAMCLTAAFLPRYFESSKARIGMKMTLRNRIPSPYARCFQNLFAILK